jgi:hypothetical protein
LLVAGYININKGDYHKTLGDEKFATLLAQVEPHAQQIVEQALREEV